MPSQKHKLWFKEIEDKLKEIFRHREMFKVRELLWHRGRDSIEGKLLLSN